MHKIDSVCPSTIQIFNGKIFPYSISLNNFMHFTVISLVSERLISLNVFQFHEKVNGQKTIDYRKDQFFFEKCNNHIKSMIAFLG